tara:strand:+ start:481 stop:918 length:438 start_codon:yes stop_codon:yes gene_type:complete
MNTRRQLNNILNKFPKVNLEKIELSDLGDLQKLLSDMKQNLDVAQKLSTRVNSFNKEGAKIQQIVKSISSEYKKLLSETDKNESQNNKLRTKADRLLTKIFDASKKLGIKPQSIKGVKEVDQTYDKLMKINNYNDIDTKIEKFIK